MWDGCRLENAPETPKTGKPRRRWKWTRRFLWAALVLLALLVWLNGPGIRWLGPKIASHFMEKSGVRGGFELEGSLSGGISVKNLRLATDSTLKELKLGSATPFYRVSELVHGRVDGIRIDGLHVDLNLDAKSAETKPDTEAKKPFDAKALGETLRTIRGKVLPLAVDLTDISLATTKDGKPFLTLAPSDLHHTPGDSAIRIDLGSLTDATGRAWPAAKSVITWELEKLHLDRIDPLPDISVRDLALAMPLNEEPSAECELGINEATFLLGASPGFSSLRLDLRDGRLSAAEIATRFGVKLPVGADLTSLSVNVDGVLPDPKSATGEARLLLENIVSGEWKAPKLSLDAKLDDSQATVAASGEALNSGFSLHAEAPVSRDGGKLGVGDVKGNFNVAEVARLMTALSENVKAIDPATPVPASSLDGNFQIAMKEMKPASADVSLSLKPVDPQVASALDLVGRWEPEKPLDVKLQLDGAKLAATYDLKSATYSGNSTFEGFRSARIDPWLAAFKAASGGAVDLSGTWIGGGDVKGAIHHGELAIGALDFHRKDAQAIQAKGTVRYRWPEEVIVKGLGATAGDQSVSLNAKLADGWLELTDLGWRERDTMFATGTAKLPVPQDFSKWKETLANDTRPLATDIDTQVLPLVLLKQWVPAAAKLDPRSTGRVKLLVSGTYAKPVIDAIIEAKNLRSPDQPKLPPAELTIKLVGKDGRLSVDGRVTAPDYPPTVLTASMPFRPAEWAEKPGLVLTEKISARVDLPRLDLSRFTSLVPAARKISGTVTGNVDVAGEIGKPDIKGRVDLTNLGFTPVNDDIPTVNGAGLGVNFTSQKITVENLKATVAGGTLQGGGSLTIVDGKPGPLDFRINANRLPIVRNDSLIMRASADLRLSGTLERSVLSGTASVVDSLFYRDIELLPIGSPFTAPSAAALPKIDAPAKAGSSVPEPFRNWGIDLRVRSENPFLIRGNFATGRIDMDLKVGGTFGTPSPNGEVRISDLKAELPFSTLNVRRGFVKFDGGMDPALEIRGTAEPRPYRVNLFVYGRASNPQLVLTSNPPMPDNEIMTLLATGTTTSGLENPQGASSRAMQLLAEEIRRGRFPVGRQLRPLLGLLDRVDFSVAEADPYTSESFSTATLMLSDRWYLSAGMGAEGDSRVLGIWRLSFK